MRQCHGLTKTKIDLCQIAEKDFLKHGQDVSISAVKPLGIYIYASDRIPWSLEILLKEGKDKIYKLALK